MHNILRTQQTQQTTITIPRGQNIGKTVITTLKSNKLWRHIDIKSILTKRDTKTKTNKVIIDYTINPTIKRL